jgi:dUTP pyrophosphatase
MTHTLEIRVLDPRFGTQWPLPDYATAGSAALDLRAAIDAPMQLEPGDAALLPSGLAIHIADPGLCGLIDADYQGPLLISTWNRGNAAFVIEPGDRIAQLLLVPIVRAALQVVDTFEHSARGSGGFGHTGVR